MTFFDIYDNIDFDRCILIKRYHITLNNSKITNYIYKISIIDNLVSNNNINLEVIEYKKQFMTVFEYWKEKKRNDKNCKIDVEPPNTNYNKSWVYFNNSVVNKFQLLINFDNSDKTNLFNFIKNKLILFKNKYCLNTKTVISFNVDNYKRNINEKYIKINECLIKKLKHNVFNKFINN